MLISFVVEVDALGNLQGRGALALPRPDDVQRRHRDASRPGVAHRDEGTATPYD